MEVLVSFIKIDIDRFYICMPTTVPKSVYAYKPLKKVDFEIGSVHSYTAGVRYRTFECSDKKVISLI